MKENEKNKTIKLFYDGMDYKDIAGEIGVSENTIYRYISSQGLKSKNRNKPHKSTFDLNEIGKKYNHLTIIGEKYSPMYRTWCAECICDCGNKALDTLRRLKNGEKKTCGKNSCEHHINIRRKNGSLANNTTGYKDILGSKWAVWRIGAERRKIDFDITIEEAWNIFIEQDKKCALSGIELHFQKGLVKTQTASLDRIDSTKAYTVDNIQWVHKDINIMKGAMKEENFLYYCKKITKWKK